MTRTPIAPNSEAVTRESVLGTAFDTTLRSAIRAKGLSLERLQVRLRERGLRVSLASLSNWQRGVCRPERSRSLAAVHALEEILDMRRDSLVALLGPRRPRGRFAVSKPISLPWQEICHVHDSLDRLLLQLRPPHDGQLKCISYDELFEVGANRCEQSVRARAVFQARADGVDRHVAIHHNERSALPDIRRCMFCRPGRVRSDVEAGLTAVELLFDRPLAIGETYVLEWEFAYGFQGPTSSYYYRWFRFPVRDYLLQVRFDPTATPARCYHGYQPNISSPYQDLRELRLNSWHTVHLAEQDVRPGIHGIRWEWD